MAALVDDAELTKIVYEVLNRWPVAGLAVGVVRDGELAWFHVHGVADVESGRPVDEDTVFRIGSITKTMTAVAVMQLVEQGALDLDAPAEDYLRGYSLRPAKHGFPPVTVRHLLTHTAGVRAVRGPTDLLRPTLGWGTRPGRPAPPLAEYYRGGLGVDVEPGTRFAYSNHGFATLGQIVEDVSGIPFDRYLRDRVLGQLGMHGSDLIRSERVRSRLATGYELRPAGLKAVIDRETVPAGAAGVYSTTREMARYVAALLGAGSNAHGAVLRPATLAEMFQPHYQLDPRLPSIGLAFFRDEVGGHRTVGHDGIWKGFLSAMTLVPDDGLGVIAFTNTGRFRPGGAADAVADAVLRSLLDVPDEAVRGDVPQDPVTWSELCGWYSLGPGLLTDPQPRMLFGAGLEVVVRRDHLTVRVPLLPGGARLHPDSGDPDLFHVDLSTTGAGISSVVFGRDPGGRVTTMHTHLADQPISFHKRPDIRNPRPWVTGALAAGATTALALRHRRGQRALVDLRTGAPPADGA